MFVELLKNIIFNTSLLLTYVDVIDIDDICHASVVSKLSLERVFETKCSLTMSSISYLLNFSNGIIVDNFNFNKNKAYTIEMQEYSNNVATNLGHCFVLINFDDKWFKLDSYFNEKIFSYSQIDILSLINKKWIDMIEYDTIGWNNATVRWLICEYDYCTEKSSIDLMYKSLINRAKNRFDNEDIGKDDLYMELLLYTKNLSIIKKQLEENN